MDDMEIEEKTVEEQADSGSSKKPGLKLTERDRILLFVIIIVALVFCSYYFGYKNISAAVVKEREQKDILMEKYQALYPLAKNKDSYIKQTDTLNSDFDDILAKYPNGTSQEELIVLTKSFEENADVFVSSLSMSDIMAAYQFGQVMSTNPSGEGGRAYTTDMVGHKTTLTMALNSNYDNMKELIKEINQYKGRKFTIDSLSLASQDGTDVAANLVVSAYDITGADRPYKNVTVEDVPLGTKNLFISKLTSMENASTVVSDYDLFVAVHPYEAGKNNVSLGLNKDALGVNTLGAEGNALQNITITVNGKNGKYKVSYKLGDQMYPAENFAAGADFDCGDSIDLLVISSARTGSDDKSAAKINLVNGSDKAVNLFVYGDDSKTPRVALGTTSGTVNVEN